MLSPSLLCMHAQIACARANVAGSILDGWRIGPGSQGLRLLASDVLSLVEARERRQRSAQMEAAGYIIYLNGTPITWSSRKLTPLRVLDAVLP